MDVNDYQIQAVRTLIAKPDFELTGKQIMTIWCGIGLSGEAGEVANHIKKGIFHQHGIDVEKLSEEIGDVLWYAAALCETLGLEMSDVMQQNIDKLNKRYPNGYTPSDSKERRDVK